MKTIAVPEERLRMMRRAFGVFRDLDESDIAYNTHWCLERCREVRITAKLEYDRLGELLEDYYKEKAK